MTVEALFERHKLQKIVDREGYADVSTMPSILICHGLIFSGCAAS